jgi:aspartate/methionine/tyrosine aminotransferase
MKVAARAQVPPFAVMEIIAAANARRALGQDVLNLAAGEPSTGAAPAVLRSAIDLLSAGDPLGYTEALGMPALRAAIARHYLDAYRTPVDAGRIAVTTGSSGGFVLAFLAAFDPGDRVALARPGYPAYRNILAALGCEVVEVPCGPATRYQPTVALLAAAHARAPLTGLVVASPANPTGTMIGPEDLGAISRWCASAGVRLISDEIYHGITHTGAPAATAAGLPSGTVVVNSFSKYWGMTGWRLGWLVLPEDLVGPVEALAGNLALCPPALAQHAGITALGPAGMAAARATAEQYRAARALVLARLPELGWASAAPADGAFYLYADISASGLDAPAWCARLLDEAGVALTPGTDFDPVDGHRFVRLSFASSIEVVASAIDRIVGWQAGLR